MEKNYRDIDFPQTAEERAKDLNAILLENLPAEAKSFVALLSRYFEETYAKRAIQSPGQSTLTPKEHALVYYAQVVEKLQAENADNHVAFADKTVRAIVGKNYPDQLANAYIRPLAPTQEEKALRWLEATGLSEFPSEKIRWIRNGDAPILESRRINTLTPGGPEELQPPSRGLIGKIVRRSGYNRREI